ncbi:hypothetical protein M1N07_03900, partial [Thermodesulfovibrionales bacterium]|nr:hypothetical protein [Thermodesulfovibrionales bacterium]
PTSKEITVETMAVSTLNMIGSTTAPDNKILKSTGLEKMLNTSARSGKMINRANTKKLRPIESLNPIFK